MFSHTPRPLFILTHVKCNLVSKFKAYFQTKDSAFLALSLIRVFKVFLSLFNTEDEQPTIIMTETIMHIFTRSGINNQLASSQEL